MITYAFEDIFKPNEYNIVDTHYEKTIEESLPKAVFRDPKDTSQVRSQEHLIHSF